VLSKTEFEILLHLARNRGKVVSRGELTSEVWGFATVAVDSHISALRRKLEEHEPRLIHTVHGVGYAFAAAALTEATTVEAVELLEGQDPRSAHSAAWNSVQ
jgi:DNA-binding response OmpR family regulator